MSTDLELLNRDVSNLKSEMAQVSVLVERIDTTIEKLTEVSTSISQLLAVQGSRLDQQEKSSTQLSLLIEKRRDEVSESVQILHNRINNNEKEFREELAKMNANILAELKKISEDNKSQYTKVTEKISGLEKWMWIVMGGSAVVGFILSRLDISKFFG